MAGASINPALYQADRDRKIWLVGRKPPLDNKLIMLKYPICGWRLTVMPVGFIEIELVMVVKPSGKL